MIQLPKNGTEVISSYIFWRRACSGRSVAVAGTSCITDAFDMICFDIYDYVIVVIVIIVVVIIVIIVVVVVCAIDGNIVGVSR